MRPAKQRERAAVRECSRVDNFAGGWTETGQLGGCRFIAQSSIYRHKLCDPGRWRGHSSGDRQLAGWSGRDKKPRRQMARATFNGHKLTNYKFKNSWKFIISQIEFMVRRRHNTYKYMHMHPFLFTWSKFITKLVNFRRRDFLVFFGGAPLDSAELGATKRRGASLYHHRVSTHTHIHIHIFKLFPVRSKLKNF